MNQNEPVRWSCLKNGEMASQHHEDLSLDGRQLRDTPELRRGLSARLAEVEDTLRDPARLVAAQKQDPALTRLRTELETDQADDYRTYFGTLPPDRRM